MNDPIKLFREGNKIFSAIGELAGQIGQMNTPGQAKLIIKRVNEYEELVDVLKRQSNLILDLQAQNRELMDKALEEIKNLAKRIAVKSEMETRQDFVNDCIDKKEFDEAIQDLKEYPERMVKLFKEKVGTVIE